MNILDIARRVRERRQEMSAEPVALAEAVERMAAALREIRMTDSGMGMRMIASHTLRELGIPLTEDGDESSV